MRMLLTVFAALVVLQAQGQTSAAPVLHPIDEKGLAELKAKSKGSVLVLNFWATWCKPCVEEFPELLKLRQTYAARGVQLVFVSIDDDARARQKVLAFLKKMKVSFPSYLKSSSDDERFINAVDPAWSGALPATFVFDKSGRLVETIVEETTFKELEKRVKPLL
ncbi:MAG: TlpA family protein disulfide reductase [Ignavibacteriae bacterium]|nr:TlpA family protein disulfide reductase [Ignavibacteriota bacterium]